MNKSILFPATITLLLLLTGCKENSVEPESDTGTAQVQITTSGDNKNSNPYLLLINESSEQEVERPDEVASKDVWEETQNLELEEGSHEIELSAVAPNCTIAGENPMEISVEVGQTTDVKFNVVCSAALNNKVVFVSDRDGPLDLYVANPAETRVDGFTNYKRLTNDDYLESNPAVSSDGTKITYAQSGNIWVINADGTNPTQLTDSRLDKKPVWISGNTKIAFISDREGVPLLYVMNADGSEQAGVSTDLPIRDVNDCDDKEEDIHPSQKAVDSTCDVIVAMGEGNGTEIGWVDLDSDGDGVTDQVTDNDHFDGYPALSPDRSEILIVVEDGERTKNFRVIDAKTGETLSTSDFEPGFIDDQAFPGWSPDGTEIIFTSVNPASAKVSGSAVMAKDYNSSRSNKPSTGIEIDTDKTDFNVMHVAWSPAW